jgi:hypothetical protein
MDPNEANNEVVAEEVVAEPVIEPEVPVVPEDGETDAEDQEWNDAADELFPGLKSGKKKETNKEEGEEDEPADGGEKPKTTEKTGKGKAAPAETPEQKAAREAKAAADEEEVAKEDGPPDTTARDNRLAARQYEQEVATVKQDIRAKMFADVPSELRDRDGDPIRGLEDVMKLIKPLPRKKQGSGSTQLSLSLTRLFKMLTNK